MSIVTILICLLISALPALAADFSLNGDGSVTDLNSGLVWQGGSSAAPTGRTAFDYCDQAAATDFYRWRLPTRAELTELDTSLNSQAPSIYWVSLGISSEAGLYCFADGAYFPSAKISTSPLVRCVSEDLMAPVVEAVKRWSESWQNGDIEGFLATYVRGYSPDSEMDNILWQEQLRQRFDSVEDFTLKVSTEEINILNDLSVEIVLVQSYRSALNQDRVRKRLLLVQQKGRWLITREEQLSSLPRHGASTVTTYYQ